MRRFKTTPQKKIAGMVILFVFIPIFILWYWIFFLDNKPGLDTGIILVAVGALLIYLYIKYKKQIDAVASKGDLPSSAEAEEPVSLDGEEFDESGDEFDEPVEMPSNPGKQK